MIESNSLQHFYIPEEQSIYLLSRRDATRLKRWFKLCQLQLEKLGYRDVRLIGQGAYGFVFCGVQQDGVSHVFKFSRFDLAKHIQDRLSEEAQMLSYVNHPRVPKYIEYQALNKQHVLVMEYAKGVDLERYSLSFGPLPASDLLTIASQLHSVLLQLRHQKRNGGIHPIVHGDIKPSNLMWDASQQNLAVIDWGSSVFAQLDEKQHAIASSSLQLISEGNQATNARLGDIYFIGNAQLKGELSSPRFDEQGVASTLYALAAGQSSRYARHVIRPCSLNLPQEFARTLEAMLSDDPEQQQRAGDYFMKHMPRMARIICRTGPETPIGELPISVEAKANVDTVVYSSRKSFLRNGGVVSAIPKVNDAQFERYYKHYLQGMGETEKAFITAISRLGKYPVVGGLSFRWSEQQVAVDCDLSLFDEALLKSFEASVNSAVTLARAVEREGLFKTCLFDARRTIHLSRSSATERFIAGPEINIPFQVQALAFDESVGQMHSYFEDGDDPDEQLQLPVGMLEVLAQLNQIQHSGCIIFEVLEQHLKIHNYFTLIDDAKIDLFNELLQQLIAQIPMINGVGISGYMKLPFKSTRVFSKKISWPDKFYPVAKRSHSNPSS